MSDCKSDCSAGAFQGPVPDEFLRIKSRLFIQIKTAHPPQIKP